LQCCNCYLKRPGNSDWYSKNGCTQCKQRQDPAAALKAAEAKAAAEAEAAKAADEARARQAREREEARKKDEEEKAKKEREIAEALKRDEEEKAKKEREDLDMAILASLLLQFGLEANEHMVCFERLGVRRIEELHDVTDADVEGLGLKAVTKNRLLRLLSAQKVLSAGYGAPPLPAVAVTGQGPFMAAGAIGGGPGVGLASASAVGVAVAAVASTTLSRANRHSADIMESPVFKPLGLSSNFVPQKSCLEYVQDECARAIPEIQPHLQALIQAAREVASSLLDLGRGGDLDPQRLIAVVLYTLDVAQYAIGASTEANFYQGINKALQKREPRLLLDLSGYLHFLLSALDRLPKEPEGDFFRGVGPDAVATVAAHYALGTRVVWSGISSTSRSLAKAKEFAKGGGVVFRVRAVSGVSVASFSSYPDEEEVLFAPNFKAQVARSLYSDPAHPDCRFVDLAESRAQQHVF